MRLVILVCFAAIFFTGCSSSLRRELKKAEDYAADLKHDLDLCMKERGKLLLIHRDHLRILRESEKRAREK